MYLTKVGVVFFFFKLRDFALVVNLVVNPVVTSVDI